MEVNDLRLPPISLKNSLKISPDEKSRKIDILVQALRMVAKDFDIQRSELLIPDDCEKYGFVEGKHNLGLMLHFLADMIEE